MRCCAKRHSRGSVSLPPSVSVSLSKNKQQRPRKAPNTSIPSSKPDRHIFPFSLYNIKLPPLQLFSRPRRPLSVFLSPFFLVPVKISQTSFVFEKEMVKYQKKSQWRKSKDYIFDEDEESGLDRFGLVCGNSSYINNKRLKPKFLFVVFISLVSCCLVLVPLLLSLSSSFSLFQGDDKEGLNGFLCSSVPNDTICCDKRSRRSDTCVMKGDVRTHAASSSLILYRRSSGLIDSVSGLSDGGADEAEVQHEKIRPYSRKWETNVMNTIDELDLIVKRGSGIHHRCDVHHDVPAVFFSTGGYTGNLYHEFNDGIIPLYITSQHMNKKVVFVILEYHSWWITKYGDILSQLSDYPPIDFSKDGRVHCFPEATLGLRIHDELTVDPALMGANKTISNFHDLLDRAYWPRIRGLIEDEEREAEAARSGVESLRTATQKQDAARPELGTTKQKQDLPIPKLVILARNGSRAITNQDSLVKLAEAIGFTVEVVRPERNTELAQIYRALNSSDVMVGVHGAAMTHFLFMKPGSVFIQVIPLGTDWAAQTYYEEPATKLGLSYIGYKILPQESSLYKDYRKDDPILMDPDSVNRKGWEFTKKIYLDGQSVSLDLRRFQKRLLRAYYYARARKNGKLVTSE